MIGLLLQLTTAAQAVNKADTKKRRIRQSGRAVFISPGRVLEHFNFEIVSTGEMLWPCKTKWRKVREFGVGGLCPPLRDKLKAKLL